MTKTKKITFSLLLAILVISILCQSFMYIGWHIGWRLHITQQFLSGGNYVTSFLDINPPILMYEYIPAVLLAKGIGFSLATALRITVYIFAIASLWLCYRISSRLFTEKDRLVQAGLLITLAIIFFILPAMEFGQRQHFVLFFTIPYLLNAALLTTDKRVSNGITIWMGIFAGIGFITNIQFLLLFIFIELFLMGKCRSVKSLVRKDTLMIVCILTLYILSVLIITPNYIHIILPMVFFLYIPEFLASWRTMLLNPTAASWLLTFLLFPFHFKRSSYKSLLSVLFIAMTFSFILFVLARKSWYFDIMPTLSFSFLLLTIYLIEDMRNIRYLKSSSMKTETKLLIATILSYAVLILFPIKDIFVYTRSSISYRMNATNEINLMIDYVRQQAEGKPIYIFSVSVDPGTTLENYAHVMFSNNMPRLWMLPGILKKTKENLSPSQEIKLKQAKKLMFDAVIKSFKKYDPALVIIQTENAKTAIHDNAFSYIDYFSQDPRFKKIWSQYHFTHQINMYAIYTQRR